MAKNKLNLGTARASDDVLSPEELPTNSPSGSQEAPRAPWANITRSVHRVPAITEETVLPYMDSAYELSTPDAPVVDSDVAHAKTPLTPHARRAVRENFGGGQGGARKDVKR